MNGTFKPKSRTIKPPFPSFDHARERERVPKRPRNDLPSTWTLGGRLKRPSGTEKTSRLSNVRFLKPRHLAKKSQDVFKKSTPPGVPPENQSWRMRERMKTVSVALVVCLNVGVDPPDVVKTHPCAVTECWVDPTMLNPQRAIEAIGNNLQKQYERWQPRARYRQVS